MDIKETTKAVNLLRQRYLGKILPKSAVIAILMQAGIEPTDILLEIFIKKYMFTVPLEYTKDSTLQYRFSTHPIYYLSLQQVIDVAEQIERLEREIKRIDRKIKRLKNKYNL